MEQFPNNELEYVVNDYDDVTDFEDGNESPRIGSSSTDDGSVDSDFEDDFEMNDPRTDTSALEARKGKDIQGIPWERLNFTREEYRESRLKQYKNYESLSCSREDLEKECKNVEKGHNFYDFQFNTRKSKEVLNVAKPIVPTLNYPGSMDQMLSRVQISTMTVKDNLMVAGGFQGEVICKHLSQPGVAYCTKLATDENAITNSVDVHHSNSGPVRVITANNDAQVRVLDGRNFSCLNRFTFPWSVNNISVSPDGKFLAVLGDSPECLLADAQSGKVVSNLNGHLDYSFASAWHPDGRILATGNQDTTCRLWDIRNLSESVAVLKGRMGAIRAIRFTSDGSFTAMAEPADFVHVFDTRSDYAAVQEIDLFGEIAGISFSPDADALFVGVSDRTYGSLLEFNRRSFDNYTGCIF